MPCMKDYGKTWDYKGTYNHHSFETLRVKDGKVEFYHGPVKFPRYRKYANQYGVSGFKKV